MRRFSTIAVLLAASLAAFASKELTVQELAARAEAASPGDRPPLYIEIAERQLKSAEISYKLDLERARNLQGHPIELLNSARLMEQARQEVIRATVGYNQAQLRLHVALGRPPLAGSALSPAGSN